MPRLDATWVVALAGALFAGCLTFVLLQVRELRSEERARAKLARRLRSLSLGDAMEVEGVKQLLREERLSRVPLLHALLRLVPRVESLRLLLEQAALRMRVGSFLLLSFALAAVGLTASALLGLPAALAPGAALGAGALPYAAAVRRKRKRREVFESQFPEAIEMLGRAIRAGHAFSTAFQMVGEESPDPLGEEFRRCAEEHKFGMPLRESLIKLTDRMELLDLRIFVTAVLVQREVGGNLAEVLDKLAYTIRERFKILRQVRVYTAQGRLTGYMLGALPLAVLGLIYAINASYVRILFERAAGRAMLTAAAVLQVTGFLLIRRIVRVRV